MSARQNAAKCGIHRKNSHASSVVRQFVARQKTCGASKSERKSNDKNMLHQKTTQNAIAAMSRLAELYRIDQPASSSDIAKARNLAQPLVAKVLTTLARAGLINGSPGPGGGYRFAKDPREISLLDVASLFERDADTACPFGPGWCGSNQPCPLHRSLLAMKQIETDYLKNTTFDVFIGEFKAKLQKSPKKK